MASGSGPLNFVRCQTSNAGENTKLSIQLYPSTMSAIKKRKLNGSSLSAAAPKIRTSKMSTQAAKSSARPTKPSAKQVVRSKPAEPESSEEEEEDEEDDKAEEENGANEDQDEQRPQNGDTTTEPTAKKTFADLGIIESLCEACENLGFKHPTPIQEQSIPIALEGRDM